MPPAAHLTEELKDTLTLILAGGQGERLKPLTLNRAKPAVPFGGSYRIIDEVIEEQLVVLVIRVGHRTDVYRSK